MTASTSTTRVNFARKKTFAQLLASLGLTSAFRFNEPSGAQLVDLLGGNHGSYVNSPTMGVATSIPDDAGADAQVTLNGSTQYATVPDANSLDVGDTFVLGGVCTRRVAGVKHYLVQKGATSPGVYVSAANLLTLEKVGTADIVASTVTIGTGAFFWCITKTGSAVKMYVAQAGVVASLDVTGVVTNQTCASTASALEWGRSAAPGNYFDGQMDEGFIGAAILTPAQVASLAVAFLQGELNGPFDNISSRVRGYASRNGRPATGGNDQIGQMQLTCRNAEPPPSTERHFFTPERNLVPNASFGSGLHDVDDGTTLSGLVTAGAALGWVADAPTGAGSYCLRVVTPASADRGFAEAVEGQYRSGQAVAYSVSAKAESGTPTVQVGMASAGTPTDIDTHSVVLSTSWQEFGPYVLTPTADRSDLAVFVRDHAGSGVTFRVSKVRVNRGSTLNTWVNGPTWPMLQPGALVHLKETVSGTDKYLFAGHVEETGWTVDPLTATVTVQDAFQDLSVPVDATFSAIPAWRVRQGLINQAIRAIEGAYENLCINGSFPVNTAGWQLVGSTARNTSEKPVGTASLEIPGGSGAIYNSSGTAVPLQVLGNNRVVTLSFYAKLRGASDDITVTFQRYGQSAGAENMTVTTGTAQRPSPTSSGYTRYSIPMYLSTDTTLLSFSMNPLSADTARGVYAGGFMLSYGYDVPAYTDFGNPKGRLYNWLSTSAVDLVDGWSNLVTNPEAITNATGYTAAGNHLQFTQPANASNKSDTDSNTYTITAISLSNGIHYIAVENYHGTSANTVALSGAGATWASVATVTFNGGKNRLTVFRGVVSSTTNITITVGGGQTATGAAWQTWQLSGHDTSGTNGSGSVIQSATASAAAASVAVSFSGALTSPFSGVFVAMAADTSTAFTPPSDFTSGTVLQNAAPVGTLNAAYKAIGGQFTTTATAVGATNTAAIVVEVKPGTAASTVTRVTAGGYTGGYATAIQDVITGANSGVYYPVPGTVRAGRTVTARLTIDAASPNINITMGFRSLGSDDVVTNVRATNISGISHGSGVVTTIYFTPTADRSDLVVWLSVNAAATITFSGLMVAVRGDVAAAYARTGFSSPATLSQYNTLSTVADSTLGRDVYEVVTYAVAGSGVTFNTDLPQVNGVAQTVAVKLWVPSGTDTVTIGLGDPYGVNAAVSNSMTCALTTTPTTFYLPFTGSADELVDGAGVVGWVASTGSATTFRMADIAVTLGTATQPYAPIQAGGIDVADVDIVTQTFVQVNAKDKLAEANVSQAAHWIRPIKDWPYSEYASRARQSLATKTPVVTLTSIQGLGQVNLRRSGTYQRVVVAYGTAGYDNIAVATAPAAIRNRTGTVRELAISAGTWVADYATAKAIADLRLSREQIARALPTLDLIDQVPTIFDLEPDDLVLVTTGNPTRDLLMDAVPLSLLTRTITKSDGTFRRASYETEEFRSS